MIDFTNCPVDDTSWVLHDSEGNTHPIQHTAELAYARLKIAEGRLSGYYLTRDGDENNYYINKFGCIEQWPSGLFDSYDNMAGAILDACLASKQIDKEIIDGFLKGNIEIDGLISATKLIAKSDGPLAAIRYIVSEFEKNFDCLELSLIQAKKYYDNFVR